MIKTYKSLEYNLKKEIKRNRLLDVSRVERGIGKTKLLRELAIENDFVIFVDNSRLAKAWNNDIGKKIYFSWMESLIGYRFKGVLLEECLSEEQEKFARKYFNVVGGYSSNYIKPKKK